MATLKAALPRVEADLKRCQGLLAEAREEKGRALAEGSGWAVQAESLSKALAEERAAAAVRERALFEASEEINSVRNERARAMESREVLASAVARLGESNKRLMEEAESSSTMQASIEELTGTCDSLRKALQAAREEASAATLRMGELSGLIEERDSLRFRVESLTKELTEQRVRAVDLASRGAARELVIEENARSAYERSHDALRATSEKAAARDEASRLSRVLSSINERLCDALRLFARVVPSARIGVDAAEAADEVLKVAAAVDARIRLHEQRVAELEGVVRSERAAAAEMQRVNASQRHAAEASEIKISSLVRENTILQRELSLLSASRSGKQWTDPKPSSSQAPPANGFNSNWASESPRQGGPLEEGELLSELRSSRIQLAARFAEMRRQRSAVEST